MVAHAPEHHLLLGDTEALQRRRQCRAGRSPAAENTGGRNGWGSGSSTPFRLARYSSPCSRWRSTNPALLRSSRRASPVGCVASFPSAAGSPSPMRSATSIRSGSARADIWFASATASAIFDAAGIAACSDRAQQRDREQRCRPPDPREAGHSRATGPRACCGRRTLGVAAKIHFDAEQAVVLRDAVRARQRARLDLTAAEFRPRDRRWWCPPSPRSGARRRPRSRPPARCESLPTFRSASRSGSP